MAASPAAAEAPDAAPVRKVNEGGFSLEVINGPEAPEEHPFLMELGPRQELRQESETEVGVFSSGELEFSIQAISQHDAEGATVPTTVTVTGPEEITMTVHFRAGNPAAGGAPFVYPILSGSGWEGGWHGYASLITGEPKPAEATPLAPPTEPAPVPTCKVPALRGDSLRGAKARLRASHCAVGAVHLADGATAAKGKVVKQSRAAGTVLAAGATVAVKVGEPNG
jgi:hypothetical protein